MDAADINGMVTNSDQHCTMPPESSSTNMELSVIGEMYYLGVEIYHNKSHLLNHVSLEGGRGRLIYSIIGSVRCTGHITAQYITLFGNIIIRNPTATYIYDE